MKLLSISFILLFIHINSFLYAAAQQPVLDLDGDEVKPGVEYYVRFHFLGPNGGVTLPFESRSLCPAPVIEDLENRLGSPITFQPVDTTEGTIRENSTELYIRFPGRVTGCHNRAGVWRVEYNESARKFFIMAGSLVANPWSHFRLVQYQAPGTLRRYTFATCQTVVGLRCLHVGTYQQGSHTHMSVNTQADDVPFVVYIIKRQSAGIKLPE